MGSIPDSISAQGLSACQEDGCSRPLMARGRCRKHYKRWYTETTADARPRASWVKTKTPERRFWEKVDKRGPDECWPWTASRMKFGHGEFFVSPERGKVPAHSYARELHEGRPCPPGMETCHRCDNPPCCNPAHLYFGTRRQNVDDMIKRGRMLVGSARSSAKLTEDQVLEIRVRAATGEPRKRIAADFGISHDYVTQITGGSIWRHVGGPVRHSQPTRRDNVA